MSISFLSRDRRVLVGFFLLILLGIVQLTALQANFSLASPEPAEKIEEYIRQLQAPEGKVKHLFTINPGGPIFELSAPMKALIKQGNTIQARLLRELKDAGHRNEVALILANVGDKDALQPLIELLPTAEKLTKEETFSTMCLLYALWQLTGKELGIHHKWSPAYTPQFRKQWLSWYTSNKDYLYTPTTPKLTAYRWGRDAILVDVEAKLARRPTAEYRKEHPWINYAEIKNWRDDQAYEKKLKDFCFSLIVNLCWNPNGHTPAEAIPALARLSDPRALAALHQLSTFAESLDEYLCFNLIWRLEERGDPSSLPYLKDLQKLATRKEQADALEQRRQGVIERNRLLKKYGDELKGKHLDGGQIDFIWCLEYSDGVKALLAKLRDRNNDHWLPRYLRVAAYVNEESVRACLKDMTRDDTRDERAQTMAHGALAQQGDKESLEQLKRSLTHKKPGVRLAAAEGLWHLGNREGFRTLLDLLELRPLEENGEAGRGGKGSEKDEPNVKIIRTACKILGEMGDRSAIKALQSLLPQNLNGVLAGRGSGTGWPGRPDVVALAKLGDFSGIDVLRASIRKGDPLNVTGTWVSGGDFVEIGLKRFIPELLPLFEERDEGKRVQAAQAILILLERGK